MMTTWLATAVFTGMILTVAYAALVYRYLLCRSGIAGFVGVLATATTLVGISALIMLGADQLDAGGLFVHLLFIVAASFLGGPIGWAVFRTAARRIEQRG